MSVTIRWWTRISVKKKTGNELVKKAKPHRGLQSYWKQEKTLNYVGRAEGHEQPFLHANREQQTKESMVVDGTSCCVILECLVTSIACVTWPVSLLTKWPTTMCRFASVLSSNFSLKRKSLLQKFTRDFSVLMEVCAWVRAVFEDAWNILKMGTSASERSPSNSLNWTQQGESGWDHSRRQAWLWTQ